MLKILKYLLPLYIGATLGPLGGFGVVTLLPILTQDWSVDFGTASLAITFYMAPFIIVQIFSGSIAQLFDTRKAFDYLKSIIQLPSDQVGAVLSITGLSGIIVSPLAGFLGDHFGRQVVFLAGTAIVVISMILMLVLSYSLFTYFILFLILGTGAATAWTSLNTMTVQVSTSLRKPVTSVYNATKFAGYGVSPAVLSIVYSAYHLPAVRISCIAAVIVSSLLVIKGVSDAN